jgi:YesN/AraC family two-component response regulator
VKKFNQMVQEQFLIFKKPADQAGSQEIFREAQRLLFYTGESVKEIAFQLGYEDYKYFMGSFSKTTGTSPAAFRKKSK